MNLSFQVFFNVDLNPLYAQWGEDVEIMSFNRRTQLKATYCDSLWKFPSSLDRYAPVMNINNHYNVFYLVKN